MKKRATFASDQIIDTAVELVRESGWEAVHARSIARRLGSSTMPIYSSLSSMDENEGRSERFESDFGSAPGFRAMLDRTPELRSNPLQLKTLIFVHGLASLVSTGALDLPEERLRELLADAGGAFAVQERQRRRMNNG